MQLAVLLETDLGIRTRSIQVYDTKGTYNALYVMAVSSGGVADRAGIRKGEVIYFDETQSSFYHRLADNRGKPVDINVAIGATSGSLDSCPKRAVTVTLPP
jgi:S1-C subfamily serine protease